MCIFIFGLCTHARHQQLETGAGKTSLCVTTVSVSSTAGSVMDDWTVTMAPMKPRRATAVSNSLVSLSIFFLFFKQ